MGNQERERRRVEIKKEEEKAIFENRMLELKIEEEKLEKEFRASLIN